jgi:membrane protease YdiL (CAAX protease family)
MRSLIGPVHYEPRTAWGPAGALLALLGGVIVLPFLTGLVLVAGLGLATGFDPDEWLSVRNGPSAIVLELLGSAILIAGASMLARRGGARAAEVLALRRPKGGRRAFVLIAVVATIDLAIAVGVASVVSASEAAGAQAPGETLTSGELALEILAAAIAAPIAEELGFRGFLLPALAMTRLGFWGAALATSALFAVTHWYWSAPLLFAPVFLGGVVYAWALGVTGSLWVPMALHMLLNLIATVYSWAFP